MNLCNLHLPLRRSLRLLSLLFFLGAFLPLNAQPVSGFPHDPWQWLCQFVPAPPPDHVSQFGIREMRYYKQTSEAEIIDTTQLYAHLIFNKQGLLIQGKYWELQGPHYQPTVVCEFEYDDSGCLIKLVSGKRNYTIGQYSKVSTLEYRCEDGKRVEKLPRWKGSTGSGSAKVNHYRKNTYEYDEQDRLIREKEIAYRSDKPDEMELRYTWRYVYESDGNIIKQYKLENDRTAKEYLEWEYQLRPGIKPPVLKRAIEYGQSGRKLYMFENNYYGPDETDEFPHSEKIIKHIQSRSQGSDEFSAVYSYWFMIDEKDRWQSWTLQKTYSPAEKFLIKYKY